MKMPWLPLLLLTWTGAPIQDGPRTVVAIEPRAKPHAVILIAEDEYSAAETLPAFASRHLEPDYRVSFVREDPADKTRLTGLEALDTADVLVVFARRKPLPPAQLAAIRRYVAAGKPVVGIRTACHAFCLRDKPPPDGLAAWPEFDPDVLGGHYTDHHPVGPKTRIAIADESNSNDILKGVTFDDYESPGTLYKVSPLASGTHPLLMGSIPGQPAEPLAWTFTRRDGGHSFFTSLGHKADFDNPAFSKMLRQAIDWATHTTR